MGSTTNPRIFYQFNPRIWRAFDDRNYFEISERQIELGGPLGPACSKLSPEAQALENAKFVTKKSGNSICDPIENLPATHLLVDPSGPNIAP
jgi:hypothetical protein